MLALMYQFGKGITKQEWKNLQTVKHSTHYVTVYILFTTAGFHFHIKCIHLPNGPVGTDEFLRLTGSSVETQVSAEAGGTADTKVMKF